MATGNTTTDSLADSLPTLIASALIVREQPMGMQGLVTRVSLAEGTGTKWNEVQLAKVSAQAVTESEEWNNPQQLSDTLFSVEPQVVVVQIVVTDRVARRISRNAFAQTGQLGQNAIEREKDTQGLTILDGGSTSGSPGAGVTLTSGHVSAQASQVMSNTTEPPPPGSRLYAVLHGFQIHDIEDELRGSIGTYEATQGLTVRTFSEGFRGAINGAQVMLNGNISIDSGNDAKGGVFADHWIVLVQGAAPDTEIERLPRVGGGASGIIHRDEFAYAERTSQGTSVGVFETQSDASVPTS